MQTFFCNIQILGLVLIVAMIFILYKRISMKSQALVLLYTVFVGINAYGYLIELSSATQDAALTGVKIAYVGKLYMLYTMIPLISHLTKVGLPKWLKALMFLIATVTLGLVVTCEQHTLYYSSIDYTYEGSFPHLVLGHGMVYHLYTVYLMVCMLAAMGMCAYGYFTATETIRRKQILYFFMSALLQLVGVGIYLTGITKGYDITAIFCIISVIFLMRITVRYDFVDTLSAAKDQVLDGIQTGVVIMDDANNLLYANRIAREIYPELSGFQTSDALEDILRHLDQGQYKFHENKVYTVNKQIVDNSEVKRGKVFVLNDVTVSYYYAQSLEEEVNEKTAEVRRMQNELEDFSFQIINALSTAVEAKDRYTKGHSQRVATYAREIAGRMGLTQEQQKEIYYAGLLHDIGKIRVADAIINKQGELTKEEFESIKLHTVSGYYILKNVSDVFNVADAAKWHHERYDGSGYPDGLAGDNIPLIARIIGVADSYDAMSSDRSYRRALPQETVRKEILEGMGTQFDPQIADIMIQMIDEDTGYQMRQMESGHKNILVVDDNEDDLDVAERIIRTQLHYNVFKARTIEECKKIIWEQDIDLIVADMDAKGMDGYSLMKSIQSYRNIPIIFSTSKKSVDIVNMSKQFGERDYLIKPYLPQALVEIILNVLQSSKDFK